MASSKGALWLTIAAAAGTLVVAGGLVAGPAIVACSSDRMGLLACLRQDVVEAGLLPEASEPEQTAAVVSPTPEVEAAADPTVPPPPDLNLIRAEPDGHVIVAGSAEPGIEVEVFANGDLVGKAMAEASGDWVLVPDRPLAVGTAEVSVGISGSNERSPRTFTVTIPADRISAPTVTASEAVPSVAIAEPAPVPAPIQPQARPPVAEPTPSPIAAPVAEAAPAESIAEAPESALEPKPQVAPLEEVAEVPQAAPKVAQAPEPAPEAKPTAAEPTKPVPVSRPTEQVARAPTPVEPVPAPAKPEAPPQVIEPPEQVAVAPAPAPAPEEPVGRPPPEPVETAETELGPEPAPAEPPMRLAEARPSEPPGPVPPVTPVPETPTTIDAIEIDGSANFFAGAGPEGATVELYVEGEFIASATVEGGRWLVEARGVLSLPAQRVRVDLVDPGQGGVSARAEVNFVIDVPPPAPEIEASATATGEAATAAEIATELAVAPQVAPQVESELEVDPSIPTLHATPTADPKMLRFASGKAIIRRGETLWAIAERVYGDGREYRRIVEANDDQISRPGRIFPGQVFDLPKLEDGN